METYNGWENRSTWLVKLHLDNTSKEVYQRAVEIGTQANTIKQFKSMIAPVIAEIPLLWKEKDFDVLQVDWSSLWDSFRTQGL